MITIKEAEEILKKEYHIDNFTYMVDELILPDFKTDKHEVVFNNSIFASVNQLGYSVKCDVTVYEVLLNDGAQNRRVTITQEMFRILRGQGINNAIVAFANADKRNYRLSLLTSKYEFDGNKVVKVLSNPRRYSYSLGYGTKTKTAYDFLISKGKVHSLDELIGRFSIEIVNKHFYNEIALSFTKLIGGKRENKKYQNELNIYGQTDANKQVEFAVRLIGRIVFCWFLKEKKSKAGIPLVPENMLSIDAIKNSTNYYHDVLEPLFFELLNTNQNRRKNKFINEDYYKQIPYLNGGLFSPHVDDHYKFDIATGGGQYGIVTIENGWFEHFIDVLSQYNFTVDENTSYDVELSIDPEMLGRIFENLLAEINPETGENAKKSTGSFYTPRGVVDYMVDNSLLGYLQTKTNIDEERLKALISYSKEDDDLATFDIDEKKAIINALYTVTVLDPACGSGAFPIDIIKKIVYMLQEVDPEANLWFDKATENVSILIKKEFEKKFNSGSLDYIRKLVVIQNSIFGVDIQSIAVEIARLRCFLSLVIEEKVNDVEDNRGIKALPNLDFKFIAANSLIHLEDNMQLSLFEEESHMKKLKAIREEYFGTYDSEDKKDLISEFKSVQQDMLLTTINNYAKKASDKYQKLSSWKPFDNTPSSWFDSEWMFGIKDGFDIVIGNPPYVGTGSRNTSERMDFNEKEYYKKVYSNSAEYKINLYALFMELGIRLCKKGGFSSYIVPDSFLLGMYFSKIRSFILKECNIRHIAMLGAKVFAAHVGFSVVYLFQKGRKEGSEITLIEAKSNNGIIDDTSKFSYPQSYAEKLDRKRFRVFFKAQDKNLIDKIEADSDKLGSAYVGRTGVRSKIGQKNIISKEKEEPTYQKGIISGAQIIPYCVQYEGDWININPSLLNAGGWDEFVIKNPKLLVRQTADTLIAAYDEDGYYHLNNVHSFAPKNNKWNIKFILALFNSKLMRWYYETLANEKGRAMPQTDIETLECLPIKSSKEIENKIVGLINSLLCNIDNRDIIAHIDDLVYQLYDLTPEEIALVEESVK